MGIIIVIELILLIINGLKYGYEDNIYFFFTSSS